MFRIAKTFDFSASHQLDDLPEGHKCKRLHGHNYTVEFIMESECTNEYGMVRDYGDLDVAKAAIDSLDHHHLNDIFTPTTAENLAMFLYLELTDSLPELVTVRASEGPRTWAEYTE